jgi:HAD superfamily hydrolase (TIGR01509 family)
VTAPSVTPVAAPPAAVLWDMDGTLVDTEPYWMAAEHALVAEFGGTWTDDDARSVIGSDLLDTAAVLRERGGVQLEPVQLVERLLDDVIARVLQRVPWRPGALRLLDELVARGVPLALVTMSWSRLVDAVTEALPAGTFQAIITGDNVQSGKPHPEPYLRAAAALGVDPVDCVAIEDSPTGAASAGSAGCVVLAVRNHVAIEPAPGRVVVPSLVGIGVEDLGRLVTTTPAQPSPLPGPEHAGPPDATRRRRRGLVVLGAIGALTLGAAVIANLDDDGEDGAGGPVESAPARRLEPLNLHAWVPYWALDEALADLDARVDALHEVSPFWFEATGVEEIAASPNTPSDEAERFVDTADANDIPLVASILDATAAGEMAAILADPEQRADHVDAIVDFAADGDFAGIDLDYEQFAFADGRDSWAETRPNWVAFVEELSERLHADGRTLTVSVPPVYDTRRTAQSGYWVYDHRAIAPFVDSIRVMAYDYSNASTDAGPIAPLDWVQRIITGTSDAVRDPSKLVLGIPLYGYNWPTEASGDCPDWAPGITTVTSRTVDDLARRRDVTPVHDPVTGEASFTYELDVDGACRQRRQVNFVDTEGIRDRMNLALDAGFAGASLFALGYDDNEVWDVVDDVNAALAGPVTTAPTTS